MEDKKPNNFREAALSHIPQDLVASMQQSTKVEVDGLTGLEAISKTTSSKLLPQKPEMKPQYVSLAVDGHVIKVAVDPTEGAVTMLLYLLATIFSKDKKVAKILKQFNFAFYDQNGIQLYPRQKGKKNA